MATAAHSRIPLTEHDGGVEFHALDFATLGPADRDFQALLAWWHGVRGDRAMPSRADVDPQELKQFLSRLIVIEVMRDPPDFRYRLAGTQTYDIHGVELTGRSVLDIRPSGHGKRLWNDLCELIERKAPQLSLLRFINSEEKVRSYRVLRLPLGSDGRTVDHVLVMQDFGTAGSELGKMFRELQRDADEAKRP